MFSLARSCSSCPVLRPTRSMTLSAFALYAVIFNLVPLPTGRGVSPAAAAWALGAAGQVAGRLCYQTLAVHVGARGRTLAVMAAGAGSTLLLALLPGPARAAHRGIGPGRRSTRPVHPAGSNSGQ